MSEVILIPVEEWGDHATELLYQLLEGRPPEVNISHKRMPTFEAHKAFVQSRPYQGWWLIVATEIKGQGAISRASWFNVPVGACYISKQNEIGIQIGKPYQRRGYARTALNTLIEMHKGQRLLANIAPGNEASRKLFEGFGFKHIQDTLALEQG